jgi:hypothetical protein
MGTRLPAVAARDLTRAGDTEAEEISFAQRDESVPHELRRETPELVGRADDALLEEPLQQLQQLAGGDQSLLDQPFKEYHKLAARSAVLSTERPSPCSGDALHQGTDSGAVRDSFGRDGPPLCVVVAAPTLFAARMLALRRHVRAAEQPRARPSDQSSEQASTCQPTAQTLGDCVERLIVHAASPYARPGSGMAHRLGS